MSIKHSDMPTHIRGILLSFVGFLAAWQATDFSLDYRAVLGAAVAALVGYANPAKPEATGE